MADPRHPMRDNSRALGLVSDRSASSPNQSPDTAGTAGESGDDFARALDAALDAIRTAIDDDEADAAAQQPVEPEASGAAWTMPQIATAPGVTREQNAFREISSDIAARHPELRSISDALKPEPRHTPMPNAATLASKPLPKQRPREPLSYEPYSPQIASQSGKRQSPTATIPANDTSDTPPPALRIASETAMPAAKSDHWARFDAEIDNDLSSATEQSRVRGFAPIRTGSHKAPAATAAPRARAMQPEDLPSFGKNHDDVPAGSRSKGRVLAVSAIALTAALGFGAVAVWLGNELSSPPADGDINLATATAPSTSQSLSSGLPAASNDNPARLVVSPISGKAGEAVDLAVALTAAPGERTAVLISGLPSDSTLSSGVDTGKGVWIVKPSDLDGLQLSAPASQSGSSDVKFELVASNGLTLDVQTAQLTLQPGETPVAVSSEPVTAGLAPKPVKTATVTLGAPQTNSVALVQAPSRDTQLPAPPIAPRAEAPAQVSGGGGNSGSDVSAPASVQVADRPAQSPEPVQDLNKSQAASQPVRLAAINPAPAAPPEVRTATPQPLSPEMQELVERGNALMEIGDLASARLFYERAAEAGSADAALAMAKSYDPIYFEEQDVHGMPPNPERAVQWYEKAAGLGSSEATSRLSALKARL